MHPSSKESKYIYKTVVPLMTCDISADLLRSPIGSLISLAAAAGSQPLPVLIFLKAARKKLTDAKKFKTD